jgi:hypothetical protein
MDAGTVYGPKIGRILSRTGYKRVHDRSRWVALVRGDASSLHDSCAAVPLLREWRDAIYRLTKPAHLAKLPYDYRIRAGAPHTSVAAEGYVMERYDISRAELRELQGELRQLRSLPAQLVHPAWQRVLARDCF